ESATEVPDLPRVSDLISDSELEAIGSTQSEAEVEAEIKSASSSQHVQVGSAAGVGDTQHGWFLTSLEGCHHAQSIPQEVS
ncbi:MAG: hypothetical protein ACTIJ6_09945, partial [Leucobacter sp.]